MLLQGRGCGRKPPALRDLCVAVFGVAVLVAAVVQGSDSVSVTVTALACSADKLSTLLCQLLFVLDADSTHKHTLPLKPECSPAVKVPTEVQHIPPQQEY